MFSPPPPHPWGFEPRTTCLMHTTLPPSYDYQWETKQFNSVLFKKNKKHLLKKENPANEEKKAEKETIVKK